MQNSNHSNQYLKSPSFTTYWNKNYPLFRIVDNSRVVTVTKSWNRVSTIFMYWIYQSTLCCIRNNRALIFSLALHCWWRLVTISHGMESRAFKSNILVIKQIRRKWFSCNLNRVAICICPLPITLEYSLAGAFVSVCSWSARSDVRVH